MCSQRFTQSYLMILYSGGLVVTLSSLVGLYRPIRTGVLGFVLLLVACHMTPGAGFLPTLIMESFLSAYVLFYSPVSSLYTLHVHAHTHTHTYTHAMLLPDALVHTPQRA